MTTFSNAEKYVLRGSSPFQSMNFSEYDFKTTIAMAMWLPMPI